MAINANFSADVLSGLAPLTVQFTDLSTADGGDVITSWLWDFGDGNTSIEQNPLHVYNSTGNYSVSLIVRGTGYEFTEHNIPMGTGDQELDYLVYTGGQFVAIDRFSTDIRTSPDGKTWTLRTHPGGLGNRFGIGYGNGVIVACGDNFIRSTDGITWTTQVSNQPNWAWDSVAYGNGIWVAVGRSYGVDEGLVARSTDNGITWVATTGGTIPPIYLTNVRFVNGYFVAFATFGNGFIYSSDGISWTTVTLPGDASNGDIAYNNGVYIITSTHNTTQIYRSTDFTTWTQIATGFTQRWGRIHYGLGMFVAVGQSLFNFWERAMYSIDKGLTWSIFTTQDWALTDITDNEEYFVLCNSDRNPNTAAITLESTSETSETKTDYITATELKADFSANPNTGELPLTVQFTDLTSGGVPLSWLWDFGDGNTSIEQNPVHVFQEEGTYSITLTVTTATGSDTVTNEIVVTYKRSYQIVNYGSDFRCLNLQAGGVFDSLVLPRALSADEIKYYYDNVLKGGDEVLPVF